MPGLKRDKITSYRLSQTVIQEYLESLFGMYDFKIRVRHIEAGNLPAPIR